VQQILAFSRRQPRQPQRQALAPLVVDTLGLLRATLPAGVRITTRLADGVPAAAVDANQIQQVLMNLCTNAWHAIVESANSAGEIEIGLDALATGPAGRCTHLWVRDNGTGMDAAVQSRIFEPFFTTKPVGTGTGLGLAVVHGIVSEHGGAITVDSAPGRGTTFHLYLPVDGDGLTPAVEAPDAAPLAEPDAEPTGGGAWHILCVDDDAVILLTDEGLLQNLGYRVTALASGAEAVAAVRESPQRFDLVVTDFNMPDTSGLDVARQIAAIRPDLPVLICSGYIDADLQACAAEAGVRALVHKENTVEELGATIRRVLGVPVGVK
jgi:CheY-like chemotaxis protein